MSPIEVDEAAIFNIARRITPQDLRNEYVTQACGQDQHLRTRVEALLKSLDEAPDFLCNENLSDTQAQVPIGERDGMFVGNYKLREQIGEGGFGVVFVAEQEEPIRRKVALKIIKPGMDTKEVIARFEAERQALALMTHPNIAKVFDAGTTRTGRPYFVMELVRGIAITDYCDRHRLTTNQRLQLFVTVCRAIQHAHQKGIIHRDLKPSNVMVSEHDGKAVVKVIDFGVAKAINQRISRHSIYTRFQQMIGTPMYMSPEQADLSGLDVDTRSDVYSLGVLLYELVTGATPFDKDRINEAAFEEIRRIIRDEDPAKPSTRLSSVEIDGSTVSGRRRTDLHRLTQSLRGDVDWIVMKSLDKDRNRRYQTANCFADDVQRFLDDEPVEACPPTKVYQLSKFVRRNRTIVVATSAVLLSMMAGICSTTVAMLQAKGNARSATAASREAQDANADLRLANEELRRTNSQIRALLLHQAFASAMNSDHDRTATLIREAERAGATESQKCLVMGLLEQSAGNPIEAVNHLQRAVNLNSSSLPAQSLLCRVHLERGDWNDYASAARDLKAATPVSPEDHLFLGLALLAYDQNRAVELVQEARKLHDSAAAQLIYANVTQFAAFNQRDEALLQDALEALRDAQVVLGKDHALVLLYSLFAYDAQIVMSREQDYEEYELLRYANRCAGQLAQSSNPIAANAAALHYWWVTGDFDAAERSWERAVRNEQGKLYRACYGWFLVERYGLDRALPIFQTVSDDRHVSDSLGMILAISPIHQNRAKEMWEEQICNHYVPFLLGDSPEIDKLSQKWRDELEGDELPPEKRFLLGEIDESAYLANAKSMHHRYFVAAIKALADKNSASIQRASAHLKVSIGCGYAKGGLTWHTAIARGLLSELRRSRKQPASGG